MKQSFASPLQFVVAAALTFLLVPTGGLASDSAPSDSTLPAEARYTIEVVARNTSEWARLAAERVREQLDSGIDVRVEYRPPNHVVRVGLFATPEEARPVLEEVISLGYVDASITPLRSLQIDPSLEEPATRTDALQSPEVELEPIAPMGYGAPSPAVDAHAVEARPEPALATSPPEASRKTIRAQRIVGAPLEIDGVLDEPAWSSASFASDFQQKGRKQGFPAHRDTDVAVLFDDEALYIGARVHLEDTSEVRARTSQRDDGADADRVIVSLDTYRNRQSAYNFGVTAGGSRIDYYQPRDVFQIRDYTFDPVWEGSADVNGHGWTAEMRIPFSSLRFHGGSEPQIWGINVQRVSPAVRLYAFWVVVPGDETGWASRFGDLVGLDGVRPHKRIALVPYVAVQDESADATLSNGPFPTEGNEWRAGGEFMMDVTPGLSLEATFNPDFGQIEADPSVINLSAYEVFFPEKRPFFIEGAELFDGQGPRYFYSRRIGAAPRGRASAPFVDAPNETTILGAAKLIGRRPSGWSIGTLLALTDEEEARTYDPLTGVSSRVSVEPATTWGVTRLQKDLGAGSTFGVVGTVVSRDLPASGALEGLLPRQAVSGGADWNLRFAEQAYEFGGYVGGSLVEGDPEAILRLQRSSARYYQRPDADHVNLDPTRSSLDGYTAGLHLGRIKGTWQWTVSGEARSPGFELNDAGAMASADDIGTYALLSYRNSPSSSSVRRLDLSASLASGWNFGGERQYTSPQLDARVVWRNFWQTYVQVAYDTSALSDSLTRGGPLMETPTAARWRLGLSTNDARQWVWGLDGWYASDALDGRGHGLSTRALVRFADRFTFSIRPGYDESTNTRQYYTTLNGDRPEVFNKRYVFSTLEQETLYTRLRMGLAITPTLGIDLYVEPFAAVGTYGTFGELLAPGTSELRLYGTGGTTITRLPDGSYQITDGTQTFALSDGDFDVTSLRGNLVVRWDYRLGSTLYFVWAQTRDASDALGGQVEPGDLVDVLDLPERNVFTIKASFRLDVR